MAIRYSHIAAIARVLRGGYTEGRTRREGVVKRKIQSAKKEVKTMSKTNNSNNGGRQKGGTYNGGNPPTGGGH